MTVPRLHRFLGLAGIYARLDYIAVALRSHASAIEGQGARLERQEKDMSKATLAIAGIAAGLATLSTAQAKEALEQKELSERFNAFVAGKQPGDEITADELTQLAGFATAVGTAADSANQRADELKTMVDQLPDPDPSTSGQGKGDDGSDLTVPEGNGEESSTSTPTEPVTDPSAPSDSSPSEPASDPSSEPLA